jgi:GNAT superfamily N-acetyltransferase
MDEYEILDRPPLLDMDLNALFGAAWTGHIARTFAPVLGRSLAYCAATYRGQLVGFVNVAGDGGTHAFLLDPTVHPAHQRRGLGLVLVQRAATLARVAGAEWLHVDYEPHLAPFYARAGFGPTTAGLLRLAK